MTRHQRALRRSAWFAVLFAVVGGVFGMHGLTAHRVAAGIMEHSAAQLLSGGTASAAGATADGRISGNLASELARATEASAAAVGMATHAGLSSPVIQTTTLAAAGHIGDDGTYSLGALCVAVLLTGALGWVLLALAARRTTGSGLAAGAPDIRRLVASAARDRDPPDLIRLCIHRC